MKRFLALALYVLLLMLLWGFTSFVEFLQTAAIEREMHFADQGSTIRRFPRQIPQCDRELWERITDGCPEEKTYD